MADDSTVGTASWSNVGNATTSNNVYASSENLDGVTTHYLKATNFGFSVPAGSTINGIGLQIERHMSGSDITDSDVKIVKADGTIGTTDKASAVAWTTFLNAYYQYGGSSYLWGESWTSTDVNDSDFGVVLSVSSAINFSSAFVDHIRMAVCYTEGAAAPAAERRIFLID